VARSRAGVAAGASPALLPITVALAGFVAAAHLETAVEAVPVSLGLAAALLVVAAGSATWGWRVLRTPTARALRWGAGVFVVLALVWLASRTTGLPFGLAPRAPLGLLDTATALDEVLLAGAALALARGGRRRARFLPGSGFAALSVSFVLLSMGCGVGSAAPARERAVAAHGLVLYCHLF
jgi:hypothetical protein